MAEETRRRLAMSAMKRLRSAAAIVLVLAAVVGGTAALPAPAAAQGPVPDPISASGGGYVVEAGCQLGTDTSVWKTDSNGGSFGLQSVCPPNDLTSYPNGLSLGGGSAADGQYASWYTSVPAGMQIASVDVGSYFARGLSAGGWAGAWKAGGQTIGLNNTNGGIDNGGQLPGGGTLFGWSIQCRAAGGCTNNGDLIQVGEIIIIAQETQGPTMAAPTGLWQTSGYVWGNATVAASANGPSGVCDLSASLNGQALPGATTRTPDQSVWDQCGPATFDQVVNTAYYGQGPVPLVFSDADAAGLGGPVEKTVYLDNTAPTISLAGPTDASAAAGTQYITATATAFPADGVKGITCSLDDAPAQWYPGPSASIPVSGVADHHLTCFSENNAQNATTGQPNVSSPASWTLNIREPSAAAATFARIRGLKCGRVREREKIPAHWVTVHRHGKPVRVKRRAKTIVRKVRHCEPRVVTRKVCHAGHCTKQRFVVPPHTVLKSTMRVGYGKSAPVSGWLVTPSGTPLAGQPVAIMTAPDNGSNAFTLAANLTTAANGTWSTTLPPGPSRLVEAVYGGTGGIEPATSGELQLIVPAKVRILSSSAKHIPWGGTVKVTGDLAGGYLPSTGELVELFYGTRGHMQPYGVKTHVTSRRFTTSFTFGPGQTPVTFAFQFRALPDPAYAYAPAWSNTLHVRVAGSAISSCCRSR
jgi:hypothetical protein